MFEDNNPFMMIQIQDNVPRIVHNVTLDTVNAIRQKAQINAEIAYERAISDGNRICSMKRKECYEQMKKDIKRQKKERTELLLQKDDLLLMPGEQAVIAQRIANKIVQPFNIALEGTTDQLGPRLESLRSLAIEIQLLKIKRDNFIAKSKHSEAGQTSAEITTLVQQLREMTTDTRSQSQADATLRSAVATGTLVDQLYSTMMNHSIHNIACRGNALTIRFKPIFLTYEGVRYNIGDIECVIDINQLPSANAHTPYFQMQNNGTPPHGDTSYIHPHMRDGHLCFGDGQTAAVNAMKRADILGFIDVVTAIIYNYNSRSPHMGIGNWEPRRAEQLRQQRAGTEHNEHNCAECGEEIEADDYFHCDAPECDLPMHEGCAHRSEMDDQWYCSRHSQWSEYLDDHFNPDAHTIIRILHLSPNGQILRDEHIPTVHWFCDLTDQRHEAGAPREQDENWITHREWIYRYGRGRRGPGLLVPLSQPVPSPEASTTPT